MTSRGSSPRIGDGPRTAARSVGYAAWSAAPSPYVGNAERR
ncbi:hypothetical protein [Amycolatopsis sp. NPDC057786]